jgi:aspartate/methionine/tyrosine aminotransferase
LRPEGAYSVLARAQELERQGREILHLELGQPDFPTPDPIKQRGIEAIRANRTRYTPPAGMHALRERIAAVAGAQRGIGVSPEMVVVGPGCKPGLYFATQALVEPGDEVMYPDPGFPTYPAMIGVAGGKAVPVSLTEENGWSFDLDVFDEKISPRTRLIILNSPSNPTGALIPRPDLEHIAARAQACGAWILSDEIYSRLVYDDFATAPSIASVLGGLDRVVIADGFSKSYAMTGWRLGYVLAPAPLAERLELLMTHSVGSSAEFTQLAAIEALDGPQEFIAAMVAEYKRRRDRLIDLLNAVPGVRAHRPQGAFYAFPNIKSFGLPSAEIQRRLLDETGVAVLPGTDFGLAGEGYLRLCYATSMETIERAVARLADFLASPELSYRLTG